MKYNYIEPLGPFRRAVRFRLTEGLRKGGFMSFSAVQAGYAGEACRYAQTKTQTQAVRGSNFDHVGKYVEEQDAGQVIGQVSVFFEEEGKRCEMQARYAPDSTADNPIVRVTVKEGNEWVSYDVNVFEVDPRNASQLEIFALMSYADDQGISQSGSMGSYQQLRMYADNAQQNGYWEGNRKLEDFVGNKQNWMQMMEQMYKDYADSGIYSQFVSCCNVHTTLQRFQLRTVDISRLEMVNISEKAGSSYSFPALPDGVFKAFLETIADASDDGMSTEVRTRLLNHLLGRIRMKQNETGGECTLELVIQVVRDALEGLDYSLTPELKQSKELSQELDMMRSFYQSCLNKLQDLKESSVEEVEHEEFEAEGEEIDAWESFVKILEQIYRSMLRGEEPSYQIGAQSFTEKEWDRFLEKFDAIEEKIRELVRERLEKQKEKAEEQQENDEKLSEELLELLFEDRDKKDQ